VAAWLSVSPPARPSRVTIAARPSPRAGPAAQQRCARPDSAGAYAHDERDGRLARRTFLRTRQTYDYANLKRHAQRVPALRRIRSQVPTPDAVPAASRRWRAAIASDCRSGGTRIVATHRCEGGRRRVWPRLVRADRVRVLDARPDGPDCARALDDASSTTRRISGRSVDRFAPPRT